MNNATDTFAAVDGLNAALAAVTKPAETKPAVDHLANAAAHLAKVGKPTKEKPKAKGKVDLEAAAAAAPVQTQTARQKRDAATGLKDGDQAILDLLATGKSKAAVAKELGVKAYAVNAAVERQTYGRLRRSSDLAAAAAAKDAVTPAKG